MKQKKTSKKKPMRLPKHLVHLNACAAGIDVGSKSHFVAVPEGADPEPVREFSTFTDDLERLADWLICCGVTTVAMESTGIYWIPVFEILESRGIEVRLVNARHVKNVPGRKSDVLDCQWLQQLHTYGLLRGAFRPADQVCALRAYVRQRATLVKISGSHIQHMQKAMAQMNLQLHNVVSNITGATGMRIIKAILEGERDPDTLAALRDKRCKNDAKTIARSLQGNFRPEHLFSLQQAVELYEFYLAKINECDRHILAQLKSFDAIGTEGDSGDDKPPASIDEALMRISGVDLTDIDGIDTTSALKIIAEIGIDMSRWKTDKHFTSWMSLAPGAKISGGKVLSSATQKNANRAAQVFRMAAFSLTRSKSYMGSYFRRMKARLGAPKAITATARKLATIVYKMLKNRTSYIDLGQDYYEERYQSRLVQNLKRNAKHLGFELVPTEGKISAL
jgi:transposase